MTREVVERYIRKLVGRLKKESELTLVLKARLTKREYKLLQGIAGGLPEETLQEKLKLDKEHYRVLHDKLVKKLNQEKLKQELTD